MPGPQQIPRPADATPGGEPPWAGAPLDRRLGIRVERVRRVVGRIGPAVPWNPPELPFLDTPAAVLVPLFDDDGEARVILTRRSTRLRSHTGQVSFPGGRLDEGELPLAAALREAGEEVGLDPTQVEIVGQLSPLATMSSAAAITPFVGIMSRRPALRPNPDEVDHAFDVALAELMADGVYSEERWPIPGTGGERAVHFFDLPNDIVWGATARILHELLTLLVEG